MGPRNTASTSSIPQYTKPKYCEHMKYMKYFLSTIFYFTPRYSEHLCNIAIFLEGYVSRLNGAVLNIPVDSVGVSNGPTVERIL